MFQVLSCSPIKAVHEQGSKRHEIVWFISDACVRALRESFPSTRGLGKTHLCCTSYRVNDKHWIVKCKANNYWTQLSSKSTLRWVLSYFDFPIASGSRARTATSSLSPSCWSDKSLKNINKIMMKWTFYHYVRCQVGRDYGLEIGI
jgi:hypothetical protein